VGSKDAAIFAVIDPKLTAAGKQFSMSVVPQHNATGVALAEIYDGDAFDSPSRLVNLSTRGYVGTGENVLVAGFAVRNGSLPLLIRGVGPSLSAFGISNRLQRPVIAVRDVNGKVLAQNSVWGSNQDVPLADLQFISQALGAFTIPTTSADSALIFNAQPNQLYTITVSGVDDSTGNAIVEIYDASFQ
jgi:hypothetical protein